MARRIALAGALALAGCSRPPVETPAPRPVPTTAPTSSTTTTPTTVPPTTTLPVAAVPPGTAAGTVPPPAPGPPPVERAAGPPPDDAAFWRRLADCECASGRCGGPHIGWFQFSRDTAIKVGIDGSESYDEQRAAAMEWARRIHPREATTAGWPHCWKVAS
jgi:hypothetical protein